MSCQVRNEIVYKILSTSWHKSHKRMKQTIKFWYDLVKFVGFFCEKLAPKLESFDHKLHTENWYIEVRESALGFGPPWKLV